MQGGSLYQRSEERRFLGDSSFCLVLNELLQGSEPLLQLSSGMHLQMPIKWDQELMMTTMGEQVLAAQADWLDLSNVDCWRGGVHLIPDDVWRFDSVQGSLRHDAL
ncbi:MAG: hypothetical protein ACI9DC_000933 [Gammaproteobacteria bacterium]